MYQEIEEISSLAVLETILEMRGGEANPIWQYILRGFDT